MPEIIFSGRSFTLKAGESVLDGLLRGGQDVSHACRAGACQSCLMRCRRGAIPAAAQAGLKNALANMGYFLACMCRPEEDLEIEPPGQEAEFAASILALTDLAPGVKRVCLQPSADFEFRAGQYISLVRPDGLSRSYSIASVPGDDAIELHVQHQYGGQMTTWLNSEARVGDRIRIRGPAGFCYYVEGNPDQPILLAGTGTGAGPLYGLARDALRKRHSGPLWLFHGVKNIESAYLRLEMASLSRHFPNFHHRLCLLDGTSSSAEVVVAHIGDAISKQFPSLRGWRAYVCGNPEVVQPLRKQLFLSGMPLKEIFADAFLMTPPVRTGSLDEVAATLAG